TVVRAPFRESDKQVLRVEAERIPVEARTQSNAERLSLVALSRVLPEASSVRAESEGFRAKLDADVGLDAKSWKSSGDPRESLLGIRRGVQQQDDYRYAALRELRRKRLKEPLQAVRDCPAARREIVDNH